MTAPAKSNTTTNTTTGQPAQTTRTHGLRIAFFGSSLVSAYWNGAATYYRGLLGALAARGHVITFYEPDAFERQRHRDIADPPWAKVVVYPATETGVSEALAQAADADVLVKASGIGVFDAWLEAAVAARRGPERIVVFWDVDAPATLERLAADPLDPLRGLLPEYDAVLTYGGGQRVIEAYRGLGARCCRAIYNALDPATHHPISATREGEGPRPPACDLLFLGNRLPDREARVEEFFFSVARRLPDRSFVLGGNGWNADALPSNVKYIGHVYTADHNVLNGSALAVLNVHRDSMARFGTSPATRLFEAAGAASCLISDACEGIELFLQPEREILLAATGRDVERHLQALTPARAASIGARARRRILTWHTYDRRALEVEAVLDVLRSAKRGGGVGAISSRGSVEGQASWSAPGEVSPSSSSAAASRADT